MPPIRDNRVLFVFVAVTLAAILLLDAGIYAAAYFLNQ